MKCFESATKKSVSGKPSKKKRNRSENPNAHLDDKVLVIQDVTPFELADTSIVYFMM